MGQPVQCAQQDVVRAVTGTAHSYQGDWHALFTAKGIAAGTFNERMLAWINVALGSSYTGLPEAMAAFAANEGYDKWSDMDSFTIPA